MDIVFNELSLSKPANSDVVAKEALTNLLKSLIAVEKEYKNKLSLRTLESFKNFVVCECEYSIMSWLSSLSKLEKEFFLAISTKSPFIHEYPYYHFREEECKGFGYAHEHKLLSISYDPYKMWDSITYTLSMHYIDEELDQVYEVDAEVIHLAECSLGKEIKNFIQEKVKENTLFENVGVSSGVDLEKILDEKFKSLEFTQTARDSIKSLKAGDEHVKAIYFQLLELDNYFLNWNGVPTNYSNVLPSKTSPESTTRITNLNNQLTIVCPDGKSRLFDWHQRYTPGAGRIYFYPDSSDTRCYIGYIGNKLG